MTPVATSHGPGRRSSGSLARISAYLALSALCLALLVAGAGAPVVAQPVHIGLVIPGEGPLARVGVSIREGAEAAVAVENALGGYEGRPFRLVVQKDDGLWGAGMSRVVSVFYESGAIAVIGGADGRSAHLIQQVATKARVPYLTPWAADYTLSRGFIPWFFQLVPDDRQQMTALVDALGKKGHARVAVLCDDSYDADKALRALQSATADRADIALETIRSSPAESTSTSWERFEALIVLPRGAGAPTKGDLAAWQRLRLPLYLHLAAATDVMLQSLADAGILAHIPSLDAAPAIDLAADLPANYAHDAVRTLVAAVRSAGPRPAAIREALAQGIPFEDARTGPVRFDFGGRRDGVIQVVPISAP